jgi:SecD/SecF fusion protein
MKPLTWKLIICLVPLAIAALIVGRAFNNYWNGQGGFKLGVDLVGGTILIYEIDPAKKPERWDTTQAHQLAARLKSRLDPSDLYNMSIRAVSDTRFEIIMPTGGAHQIAAEEEIWKKLLDEVNKATVKVDEKSVPLALERYTTPEGHVTRLVAEILAQHPDAKIEDIRAFVAKHYPLKESDKPDSKKWEALLKATNESEEYKPVRYIVSRGHFTELANLVKEQHPDVPLQDVLRAVQADESSRRNKSKRGQSLTTEQVQERKELIAKVGSLEFRILANPEVDKDAIERATEYFKKPTSASELNKLALLGEPPPPPKGSDNSPIFETKQGRYTYSWVELGTYFRKEDGLANPRDSNDNPMSRDELDKHPDRAKILARKEHRNWMELARERESGKPILTNLGRGVDVPAFLIYSREVPGARLGEKDRDKKYEYFILTRDKEVGGQAITGDMLASASPGQGGTSNVEFRIKPEYGELFREFTSKNKKQLMGIVLDGMIESAATIQSAISTNGQITGNFTPEKVDETVKILRSGALPATLRDKPVSENTMGPTLGADTIRSGATAVVVAFVVVLAFMIIYYRFSGLVACIALFANLLLTVAFMVLIDATFTLPGLAGLVLMLGMAVDANILIYERLREERERGATLAMAIRNGYDRALPTIIDTHLSSIFTAIVLYVVGNDQLKGFGISLTVGLIISLFTSLYMTRAIFDYWLSRGWLKKLSMFRLFAKPNIDFMAIRYYWFTATVLLTIIGGGLFIYRLDSDESDPSRRKATVLNIDFIGGTAYSGELKEKMDIEQVRKELEKSKLPDLSVEQIFLSDKSYSEGTKSKLFTVRTSNKNRDEVLAAINNTLGQGGAKLLKSIHLNEPVYLPDKKTVVLSFTNPPDDKDPTKPPEPTFASRAQVSMLLVQKMQARAKELHEQADAKGQPKLAERGGALETLARQFSLEGVGRENEGRFMFMELHLPDEQTDLADLKAVLEDTRQAFTNSPQPERLEVFDSQLAGDTQLRAMYAILLSWGAILLYLWFRFGNWTFGAATVLCLIHDLFFTLGMIAACHYVHDTAFGRALLLQDFKIDLQTVAALLTLVGYSVNDTIVVFDRIREVRGKNPELTPQMINDGVNQSLGRTILTSMSVWLVVIVLYIWGGEGVHLFAFVMVIGVIVGTYSSIYIASPLLLIFGEGKTHVGAPRPQPKPEAPAPVASSTGIIAGPSTGITK